MEKSSNAIVCRYYLTLFSIRIQHINMQDFQFNFDTTLEHRTENSIPALVLKIFIVFT